MAVTFAPPFLKKLASDDSPLVDNDQIQDELARMKVSAEREDRQSRGELFAGPMAQAKPSPERSLPFPELAPPAPLSADPFSRPMAQPIPTPEPLARQTPFGLIAPPDAPPPPLPADRPPGQFRFDPEEVADAE